MADKTTIARPYAKAAFAHAFAAKQLGAWLDTLTTAATVVATPGVARLLTSPHVTIAQLAELVGSIVGDVTGAGFDQTARNFIGDLAANRRLAILPEIAGLFAAMKDEVERAVDVDVTSAAPLDERQKGELSTSLEKRLKRSIRLHCAVDPALIGGAVLRAGDLVIDGSLRSRLARIRYELTA